MEITKIISSVKEAKAAINAITGKRFYIHAEIGKLPITATVAKAALLKNDCDMFYCLDIDKEARIKITEMSHAAFIEKV